MYADRRAEAEEAKEKAAAEAAAKKVELRDRMVEVLAILKQSYMAVLVCKSYVHAQGISWTFWGDARALVLTRATWHKV